MRLPLILAAAALLASCATPFADQPWVKLYDEQYLRSEQKWPMTLPQVQQALFAHEAKCGSAPQFSIDPEQPNIAHVWYAPESSPGLSNTVLLEIARLQSESLRVQAYAHLGVQESEIQRVKNMILSPEVCE
ncbi:hypothetical protein [Paracandidimonas soli]|uniref:hypothetical protein n=1 Tax=Paracandidimonas soli TaxID=1917182 RepID=UPI00334180F6